MQSPDQAKINYLVLLKEVFRTLSFYICGDIYGQENARPKSFRGS